jgi:imidazolonepropionase-like amidohydrolase
MWIFALGLSLSSAVPAVQVPANGTVAIVGATLIDGTGRPPVENAVILIGNGRITAVGAARDTPVPAGARIVEAGGKFAIPGLADVHTHLKSGAFVFSGEDYPVHLKRLLAFGVTTAFVPSIPDATFLELKTLTAGDSGPYPRLLGVGSGFGTLDGPKPETAEEARRLVREAKSAGIDAVKLAYDDVTWLTTRSTLTLSPEVMQAIIDEAHAQGLRAFVHAPLLPHAKETLRAGADGLLHGILSAPVDDEFISMMAANGAVYVSTLSLFEGCADIAGWAARQESFDVNRLTPADVYASLKSSGTVDQWESTLDNLAYTRARLPNLRTNLERVRAAGIPVAIGTDSGFPGVVLGVSLQLEIVLHVEAGLPPLEAIGLATLGAARMLRLENEMGSIETGKRGDLVLLDADPIADIRNLRTAFLVLRGGVPYTPDELVR